MNNSRSDPSKGSREEPGDHQLVAQAQKGDLQAFDELVTRHRSRIFAMIRNMTHNEAEAWDLSQEVFIKAWKALPRFQARARFSTWLYRIAHNLVYDWARKRKLESAGELNDEIFGEERIDAASTTTPHHAAQPDDALASNELRVRIEAAIAKLSDDHRQVVVLKDIQGLAYKEIAEIMDCSMGTVMSRLHHARKNLQSLLKDERPS
ncbi:MAG: sigma-70 family RNA polymerase sigma factor [Akkermansiaceae bacterium]|nr:sigma-70 family RNA polymerase sigma factor [Akkermansiaceae bacterium]